MSRAHKRVSHGHRDSPSTPSLTAHRDSLQESAFPTQCRLHKQTANRPSAGRLSLNKCRSRRYRHSWSPSCAARRQLAKVCWRHSIRKAASIPTSNCLRYLCKISVRDVNLAWETERGERKNMPKLENWPVPRHPGRLGQLLLQNGAVPSHHWVQPASTT